MSARTAVAALLLLAACFSRPESERFSGAEAQGDTPQQGTPQRVISLIPSATETILALGAGDRLIARTDFDLDPRLAHLPSVGQGLTPSLEQLTLLQPDFVVGWPDNAARSVIGRLGEMGVAVYTPKVQTLRHVHTTTRELGERLGLSAAADSLVAAIERDLGAIQAAVEGRARPSVFYVVWYDPPTTASTGTYIDELITIAGGRNTFADAPGLWPQVSMEEVVRRQPDIVLLSQTEDNSVDVERLTTAVGWRELHAVRAGRVQTVDANLYNRPGPRVTEAARRLARILHPDALRGSAMP